MAEITYTEKTQIVFEVLTERGIYRDAIYCDVDAKPSPAALDEIVQERVANWLTIVNAPPIEEPAPAPEFEVTCEDGEVLYV